MTSMDDERWRDFPDPPPKVDIPWQRTADHDTKPVESPAEQPAEVTE